MNISFDETDLDDVSKALVRLRKIQKKLIRSGSIDLQNNIHESECRLNSKILDGIDGIHDTCIAQIYDGVGGQAKEHYVYAHCNPLAPLNIKKSEKHFYCATKCGLSFAPFYIGKGIGNRCNELNRNDGHRKIRKMIESTGKDVLVVKLQEFLTEGEALAAESKLIDILGLRHLYERNLLINLDEGFRAEERRRLYPTVSRWFLNRTKMRLHGSRSDS